MNNPTTCGAATGAASSPINTRGTEGDRLAELRTALAKKYEILTPLEASELRESYLARNVQASNEWPVVLKVLSAPATQDPTEIKLFHLESYSASKLIHPNIAVTREVEEIGGFYCYSVEHRPYFRPLRRLLDLQAWLNADQAISIAYQVAEALRHAHETGVLHLNLCPESVLIGPQDEVIVTGFGLCGDHTYEWAHKRRSDNLHAHYLSPEQANNASLDGRSDLYSLGVLIFEMMTDRVPFDSDAAELIKRKHIAQAPVPPRVFRQGLPDWISAVVMALLVKAPAERCKSAEYLCSLLKRFTQDDSAVKEDRGLAELTVSRPEQPVNTVSEIKPPEESGTVLELEDSELAEPEPEPVLRSTETDLDLFDESEYVVTVYHEGIDRDGELNPAYVHPPKRGREAFEPPTITVINAPTEQESRDTSVELPRAELPWTSDAQPPLGEKRSGHRWPLLVLISAMVIAPATLLASKDIQSGLIPNGFSSRAAGAETGPAGSPDHTIPVPSTGAAFEAGKGEGVPNSDAEQTPLQDTESLRAQPPIRSQVRRSKAPVSRRQARRVIRSSPSKVSGRRFRPTRDYRRRQPLDWRRYRYSRK